VELRVKADVQAIRDAHEALGVPVDDADLARVMGDDEVRASRRTAQLLRTPMLRQAGWVRRQESFDGLGMWDHVRRQLRLICSIGRYDDGEIWAHVSVSRADRKVPSWEELRDVKEALFPDRVALQVLPPKSEWYTIQEGSHSTPAPKGGYSEVLHLWVCLTKRLTPDFRGSAGTL
jgi:hypothetical protein